MCPESVYGEYTGRLIQGHRGSVSREELAVFKGTTVVAVRKDGRLAIAGDGQVTMGETIVKGTARKVRTIGDRGVLAGFAGSTADALTLFEKFESNLEKYRGNLARAAVELAKEWRTDRTLRRLEALLIVGDRESVYVISGNGDVIEPDDGVAAIGSGGAYARAAAVALVEHSDLDAASIARRALEIAGSICIYTNDRIVVEETS